MEINYPVHLNEKLLHFEIYEEEEIAFLEFRYYKHMIALMHTVVPKSMEGKGVASALAQHAFAFAKHQNKSVMVYCSYVLAYLKRHPELNEQIEHDSQNK